MMCYMHGGVPRMMCYMHGGVPRMMCYMHGGVSRVKCYMHGGVSRVKCYMHGGLPFVMCYMNGGVPYFHHIAQYYRCALVVALSKEASTIQNGYRKCGTHARVLSQTLTHSGNNKNY